MQAITGTCVLHEHMFSCQVELLYSLEGESSMHKDLKALIRQVEQKGYSVVPGGKHLKVKNADGKTVYTMPTTKRGLI